MWQFISGVQATQKELWILGGKGKVGLASMFQRSLVDLASVWKNISFFPCSLDIFTLLYLFSSLLPCLWETAQYRLKYCLKGPLNPKQSTNQIT